MSFWERRSFDRFVDLKTCGSARPELQVECRSGLERLPKANSTALEAASREGGGDCPVILSLLNISTETQAQSRLAVLCREVVGGRSVSGLQWHQAYRLSLPIPAFGLSAIPCPRGVGDRMLALPLFAAADPRTNAKQEGLP